MITKNNNPFAHGAIVQLVRYTVLLLLLLCGTALQAQNLVLTVTAANQTCNGAGSLSFSVANATSANITYTVYTLPNLTTPTNVSSATTVSGLSPGNYHIVASQDNNAVGPGEADATIGSDVVPLVYTVTKTPAHCGNDGILTITITSGNPVNYKITAGPVTVPPQASNIFYNLPAGSYHVIVTDNCGTEIAQDATLLSTSNVLSISDGIFPDQELPACDLITASNTITHTSPQPIIYPITATFTVYPPGGAPIVVYTQTITGGNPDELVLNQVIPFYYGESYYYELVVTDPCGVSYPPVTTPVIAPLTAAPDAGDAGCGNKFLMIKPLKYVSPYTITFTQTPAGFDPAALNVSYPGPFYGPSATFGDADNPVPMGDYTYTVTDACGHTVSPPVTTLSAPVVQPIPETSNTDCATGLGKVKINIASFYIATAVITAAPAAFSVDHPLPYDASAYVVTENGPDKGKLIMDELPPGTYTFVVTDSCGNVYDDPPTIVVIPPYTGAAPSYITRPECTTGLGSIAITHSSGVVSVIITAAPAGFTQPLPYDVSFNIFADNDNFYMDGLPAGSYTFSIATTCLNPPPQTISIAGYSVSVNDITDIPHCGAFDLDIHHTSTSIAGQSLWLQREIDPVAGTWGHPATLYPYVSGLPNADNTLPDDSVPLTNNAMNYDLAYPTGHYRVLKSYKAFGSGSVINEKICTEQLDDFYYYNTLAVLGVQSLTCSGSSADVQINAEGVTPLTYTITEKDGLPFTIANGSNNIFTNLDSAVYTVSVSDPCGGSQPFTFNVAELPSLVSASTAPDITTCDPDGNGTEDFNLSIQDSYVLNGQNPANVTLSYYSNLNDAQAGTNPLPNAITTASATIYARVQYNANTSCVAISAFDIVVKSSPVLQMKELWGGCEGEDITITADPGYATYTWDNGDTGQIITVTTPGPYTVTVTDAFGCTGSKTIQVATTAVPVITDLEVTDWTDHNNSITVITQQGGTASAQNFEYSIDGINYQDSNTFTGLEPGYYGVFVRDKFGCGIMGQSTHLLTYPKYFTPNGDGQNETWRIKFSTVAEPDLMVYIYDRYGKLITGFGADSTGWDGTYNGANLPATDYWFVVKRQNGKEFRGHFSMIR